MVRAKRQGCFICDYLIFKSLIESIQVHINMRWAKYAYKCVLMQCHA